MKSLQVGFSVKKENKVNLDTADSCKECEQRGGTVEGENQ